MGAIHNKAEDQKAVVIMLELPQEARDWIRHHFRSSIEVIMIGAEHDVKGLVLKAANHMIEDLERIGC